MCVLKRCLYQVGSVLLRYHIRETLAGMKLLNMIALFKLSLFFRFRNFAAKSKDELITLGFPAFTVEDFHDTVGLWKKYILLHLTMMMYNIL